MLFHIFCRICCIITIIFCMAVVSNTEDLDKLFYHTINNSFVSYCSRRLNKTHSIGCSSDIDGNQGIMRFLDTLDNINQFFEAKESPDYPNILIIPTKFFMNVTIMNRFVNRRQIARIKGIIVMNRAYEMGKSQAATKGFSADSQCPNAQFSLYPSDSPLRCPAHAKWNPNGVHYAFKSWPFPIALITVPNNESTIETEMRDCYRRYNNEKLVYSKRCALEIQNFMRAVGNTEIVERRNKISSQQINLRVDTHYDLVGIELAQSNILIFSNSGLPPPSFFSSSTSIDNNNNAFAPTEAVSPRANQSVGLVIMRVDSLSLFDKSAFAVNELLPTLSTLLSVVANSVKTPQFQSSSSSAFSMQREIVVVFLDAESYAYSGSTSFLLQLFSRQGVRFDMASARSIRPQHLAFVLELGPLWPSSLSANSANFPLYLHAFEHNNASRYLANQLNRAATTAAHTQAHIKFQLTNASGGALPPSSLHSFVQLWTPSLPKPPLLYLTSSKSGGAAEEQQLRFFHSFRDDQRGFAEATQSEESTARLQRFLNGLSDTLSAFLLYFSNSSQSQAVTADTLTIKTTVKANSSANQNATQTAFEYLRCFVHTDKCAVFQQLYGALYEEDRTAGPITAQHYAAQNTPLTLTQALKSLTILASGSVVPDSYCDADKNPSGLGGSHVMIMKLNGSSLCVLNQVQFQDSLLGANQNLVHSYKRAYWMLSSTFGPQRIRMFLMPLESYHAALISLGSLFTLVTLFFVLFVSTKSPVDIDE